MSRPLSGGRQSIDAGCIRHKCINISFLKRDGNAAGTPSVIPNLVRLDGHVIGFIEASLDTIGRFSNVSIIVTSVAFISFCEKRFDLSSHRLDSLEICVVHLFFLAVCFSSI
jgi:hypothetical protein